MKSFTFTKIPLQFVLVIAFVMAPCASAQANQAKGSDNERKCTAVLNKVQRYDAVADFGYINGVADFMDAVRASDLGKNLEHCRMATAMTAWGFILDAARTNTPPSLQTELRTAALLVVYGQPTQPIHVQKLKEFLRLRPWTKGFQFASSIAVDALLAHEKDPRQDKVYHSYDKDEMESALENYARQP